MGKRRSPPSLSLSPEPPPSHLRSTTTTGTTGIHSVARLPPSSVVPTVQGPVATIPSPSKRHSSFIVGVVACVGGSPRLPETIQGGDVDIIGRSSSFFFFWFAVGWLPQPTTAVVALWSRSVAVKRRHSRDSWLLLLS
ncbi:unnamed protein product [Lactuca virosa]|uniref:Uncharacterized protein n=1 Tax=Lactuca virosa TaxID=75947 RepID=A0AAU9M4K8_9ASTR|nr:unnamed protein product [Lactuca virosa]